MIVDHVTVYRWVHRFTPEFVEAARPRRHVPGDRWFVDETCVKVAGRCRHLFRPVDLYGQGVDVWLSAAHHHEPVRGLVTAVLACSHHAEFWKELTTTQTSAHTSIRP